MKYISFLFALFLFVALPAPAQAVGLLEPCANQTFCGSNLHCPTTQYFGQYLKGVPSVCRPEKDYESCGAMGNCTTRTDNRTSCVTIDSIAGNQDSKTAAICLEKKYYPQADKGNEIKDECVTTSNCPANTQCIRVTVWDQEYLGISEFVTSKRCLPTSHVPADFIQKDVTGSCGQNQECSSSETCVENTYIDIIAKKAYIPLSGLLSFKSPVCYQTKYITGPCTTYGASCTVPNGGAGYCMHTLDAGKDILRCVDATYLPGGPGSPSNYYCTSDYDCKNSATHKFCLENPVTNKKQCFSQQNIFTDMTKLPTQECGGKPCECKVASTQGCEPTGKESICAAYPDKTTAVCINYAGGGAALSSGKGTPVAAPSQLPKPDVAQQTYEAFAPKLQVDIPNLTFTDKITAQDGPSGIKYFSVPYLAVYINAVYKYALGFGVLITVVMLMYAGFRWMSAFGNTKAVSEAKTMVGNASLGLVLLFSAYTILYFLNPELPKMTALKILAPKQETYETKDTGESVPTQNQSQADSTPAGGGPFTPANSKSPVIEKLLGPLPANLAPCSPEAAIDTATKLSKLGVCVGDNNCANTASAFMNYIKCTEIKEGVAATLIARLEKSGWTTIFIDANNAQKLPLGVLWKPKGHVGISLGNGAQFDSGNMLDNMALVNKAIKETTGQNSNCTKIKGSGVVDGAACALCAKAPDFGVPKTGLDAQAWAMKPKIATGPWYAKWILVVVPQKFAQYNGPRGSCQIKGITYKEGISPALCDALSKTWVEPYDK